MLLPLVLLLASPGTALACGATCPTDGTGTAAALGVTAGLLWLILRLKTWLF